ncbi:MAG: hypothetical protein CMJ83_11595 [Planctomycetes bacterium]|nr:hypothetical protein [Planctomycetota bacterium]
MLFPYFDRTRGGGCAPRRGWSAFAFVLVTLIVLASPRPANAQKDLRKTCDRDVRFALDALEEKCAGLIKLKKIDWKKVRKRILKRMKEVKSIDDHHVLLLGVLAELRDGHARVKRDDGKIPEVIDASGVVGPGMFWCDAGKKVVVRNAWGAARSAGLKPGMQVISVGGTPVKKWLEQREADLRAVRSFSTPHHARFHALQRGLVAPKGTRMKIKARSMKGKMKTATVVYGRDHAVPFGPAVPPEGLTWAGKNIAYGKTARGYGYLHVRRSRPEILAEVDTALAAIGNVKGMILDYRGNSGGRFDHNAYLGRFVPEGKKLTFVSKIAGVGPTRYGGPVVVIINATCVSAGETGSGMFKEEGRGYVIGESPTAGMSSQKTTIELPSGRFSLYVSTRSNKAWYNAKRGLEGVGVIPHETVDLDPADLATGRDTLILRAEVLLKKFPRGKVPYRPKQFGWREPK